MASDSYCTLPLQARVVAVVWPPPPAGSCWRRRLSVPLAAAASWVFIYASWAGTWHMPVVQIRNSSSLPVISSALLQQLRPAHSHTPLFGVFVLLLLVFFSVHAACSSFTSHPLTLSCSLGFTRTYLSFLCTYAFFQPSPPYTVSVSFLPLLLTLSYTHWLLFCYLTVFFLPLLRSVK